MKPTEGTSETPTKSTCQISFLGSTQKKDMVRANLKNEKNCRQIIRFRTARMCNRTKISKPQKGSSRNLPLPSLMYIPNFKPPNYLNLQGKIITKKPTFLKLWRGAMDWKVETFKRHFWDLDWVYTSNFNTLPQCGEQIVWNRRLIKVKRGKTSYFSDSD